MSDTNNNFLLSEVFNVKGKVSTAVPFMSFKPANWNTNRCCRLLS